MFKDRMFRGAQADPPNRRSEREEGFAEWREGAGVRVAEAGGGGPF
jgi:hypothetical protein